MIDFVMPSSNYSFAFFLYLMAFLMAKNTLAARNKGGSPTALEEKTALGFELPLRRDTLNLAGMSPNPGIL